MIKQRTDIHRPSVIIPSDYDFICVRTQGEFNEGFALIEQRVYNAHKARTGANVATHAHGGNCHICGAWFMDYAVFHHIPSNEYIHAGLDCSQHIDSGHEDAFKHVAKQRRAAAKRNQQRDECAATMEALGVLEQVEGYFMPDDLGGALLGCNEKQETRLLGAHIFKMSDSEFKPYAEQFMTLIDLVRKERQWGLSVKQSEYLVTLCRKFKDLPFTIQAKREAREQMPDAPTGKFTIEGEVIGMKTEEYQATYYTIVYTEKMTVRTTEGYLVYLTVPSSISEVKRGDTVRLTVNITPSNSDAKFGIGKRPSKASILLTGEQQ